MSGCCCGPTRVSVEVASCVEDSETCDQCGDTRAAGLLAVTLVTGAGCG